MTVKSETQYDAFHDTVGVGFGEFAQWTFALNRLTNYLQHLEYRSPVPEVVEEIRQQSREIAKMKRRLSCKILFTFVTSVECKDGISKSFLINTLRINTTAVYKLWRWLEGEGEGKHLDHHGYIIKRVDNVSIEEIFDSYWTKTK